MAQADGNEALVETAGLQAGEHSGLVLEDRGGRNPQFLHAVLCQLGLPRYPTLAKVFERSSGRASLSLQAGRTFDGKKWVDQPLPSGTRPRLALINVCSEAVRTRCAEVDVGRSVREFLRRINIDGGGDSMARFKRQMLALSCCHMTIGMNTPKGPAQIDAKPIEGFQAWYTDEDGQETLWPGSIRLTPKFFESLIEHAVPLESHAIAQLQNSALALDVYSWLAHRLWRVQEPKGVMLSWRALKEQFGQEYRELGNFKVKFHAALVKAVDAYKDARIEAEREGIRLLPSPPPVKRTIAMRRRAAGEGGAEADAGASAAVAVLPAIEVPLSRAPGKRPVVATELVSAAALEQVPRFAPGWDKYALAERYKDWVMELGVMPDRADAAFLGWVKKFTKGRPPS
jgi:hypothetical protein